MGVITLKHLHLLEFSLKKKYDRFFFSQLQYFLVPLKAEVGNWIQEQKA